MSLAARQFGGSKLVLNQPQRCSPALLSLLTGSSKLPFGVGEATRAGHIERKGNVTRTFATMEKQREPQVQDTHPGKEFEMDPLPNHMRPVYKPAGKLEVRRFHLSFSIELLCSQHGKNRTCLVISCRHMGQNALIS